MRCYSLISSGVWRSKHAMPCAQHPVPMTISSIERKYDVIEPGKHLSHITDDGHF